LSSKTYSKIRIRIGNPPKPSFGGFVVGGKRGEKTGKPPRGEGKEKTGQPLRGKNRRKAKVRFQFRKDGKGSSFLSNLHNRPKVRMGTPYDQGFALWR
jgi:hypothetical protein